MTTRNIATIATMAAIAAIAITPLLAGCSVFGIRTVEEAPYEVVRDDGDIEIRAYRDLVVAQTSVDADYEEATSVAFRRLFGYLSGENTKKEKIAMTAPVVQEEAGEKIAMTAPVLQEEQGGGWTMAFVLPDGFTLEKAPDPSDPEVSLAKVEGRKVAAIRYSGYITEEKVREYSEELRTWLGENGYTPASKPRSAGYDPPWTIPFLRRNEVLIDIE